MRSTVYGWRDYFNSIPPFTIDTCSLSYDPKPPSLCWGSILGFREKLPNGCPPSDATDRECSEAYRLVPSVTPVATDFASNAAKNEKPPPKCDLCKWASCSLYQDMEILRKKRDTFKNLRKFEYVAKLKIKVCSGFTLVANGHIDFWMFDTFDPISAIVHVKGL